MPSGLTAWGVALDLVKAVRAAIIAADGLCDIAYHLGDDVNLQAERDTPTMAC